MTPFAPTSPITSRMDAASTGCGPTSRKMRCPSEIAAFSASAKSTVPRTFCHQYDPSWRSSCIRAPVAVEYTSSMGDAGCRDSSELSSSSWISDITSLW